MDRYLGAREAHRDAVGTHARRPSVHADRTQHPLAYAAPEWIDDANFDTTHHVRWAALPQPGDDAALFRTIADLVERRLDRDHLDGTLTSGEGLARLGGCLLRDSQQLGPGQPGPGSRL
jgi:Wax ester synthase-like Acyl-CoA acyltransferase domain